MASARGARGTAPHSARADFSSFFQHECSAELQALLWRPDDSVHFGLPACFMLLLRARPALANALFVATGKRIRHLPIAGQLA